jgi:NADP-dependent 3-hydroxy acid dehydrogenase YdfG
MGNGRLKEKVAVITGAAAGIGRATALVFANESARLIITDNRVEPLEQLRDELAADGVEVYAVVGDVSAEDDSKRMIAGLRRILGGWTCL